MTQIVTMMPFASDLNLGRANNECMAMLPADAWACLIDHDMQFTTSSWHAQMLEAIACKPDAGAFTVVTNRIASPWQRAQEADPNNNDIAYHRKIGEARRSRRTLLDITPTKGFGGVVTLISKAAWQEAGGYVHSMYCCDHSIFFRLKERGRSVYLIDGLYVFHMRASSGARPPLDAPKWLECPCRGVEKTPTERISIP